LVFLARQYQILLQCWTMFVVRRATFVVAVGAFITAISLVFIWNNARINTSTTDMLSKDLAFRQLDRDMSKAFPQFDDTIIVVIDAPTNFQADQVRRQLADKIRQDTLVFSSVFDPRGEDFFRKNGLLYLDTDALNDLADRLAEAQPFLASLYAKPTLSQFFDMLSLAVKKGGKFRDANNPSLDLMLSAVATTAQGVKQTTPQPLAWRQIMTGDKEDSFERRILLVQPKLDYSKLQPGVTALAKIRSLAAEITVGKAAGVRVRLTGSTALSDEELESVEEGMGLAGIISLILVTVLLLGGLRSVRMAAALMMTLVMGLVWTAAFAFLTLGALNLISVAFAVLFIGLSVDFGIHYGLRYQEEIRNGQSIDQAFLCAAKSVGGALTLCAITAAIGFYSFLPTDYLGLAELGLIAGTGMFVALFANVTFLPALIIVFSRARHASADAELPVKIIEKGNSLTELPSRYSRIVCGLAFASAIVSMFLVTKLQLDFDPLNLKNANTESVSTLLDLMQDGASESYSIDILSPNLMAADKLANRLEQLPEVKETRTLTRFIPTDQEEKLVIIDDLSLFLGTALSGKAVPIGSGDALDQQMSALKFLMAVLNSGSSAEEQGLLKTLKSIRKEDLPKLQSALLSSLFPVIDDLKTSLLATSVDLNDLPDSIKSRQIAIDGRARIEVFAAGNMRNQDELAAFVNAVKRIAPSAIGSPVIILAAGQAVVQSFYMAAAIATILIAIVLGLVLKNLRDVVLVFSPLVLAGLWTASAMVILGVQFNFANLIVLPLLFGLGAAGNIHLVLRSRQKSVNESVGMLELGMHGYQTSTPRAVMLSALTTIASFSSIALSSHPGTASMGVLLTISVALSLLATLVVLPALIKQFPNSSVT